MLLKTCQNIDSMMCWTTLLKSFWQMLQLLKHLVSFNSIFINFKKCEFLNSIQFSDGVNKPDYVEDFLRPCRIQIQMKLCIICVRADDPDTILGLNLNYISMLGNTIMIDAAKEVKNQLNFKLKSKLIWFCLLSGQKRRIQTNKGFGWEDFHPREKCLRKIWSWSVSNVNGFICFSTISRYRHCAKIARSTVLRTFLLIFFFNLVSKTFWIFIIFFWIVGNQYVKRLILKSHKHYSPRTMPTMLRTKWAFKLISNTQETNWSKYVRILIGRNAHQTDYQKKHVLFLMNKIESTEIDMLFDILTRWIYWFGFIVSFDLLNFFWNMFVQTQIHVNS